MKPRLAISMSIIVMLFSSCADNKEAMERMLWVLMGIM